ncbi:MAG: hypothetical protein AAF696_23495 [Bacteroidota bacterium]
MSEFKRLARLIKAAIPRMPLGEDRPYQLSDAHMMITDLGMQMSPEALAFMTGDDNRLDDFLMNIYHLENDIRKKAVTEFATIDPELLPKVYEEDGTIGFTVVHKNEEIVFAEYDFPPKL